MYDISYLICSTPRSGTGYASQIFSKLGLNCTHEGKFNQFSTCAYDCEDKIFGDSSWLAAPHIHRLPPGTLVLHQIRDPVKTLNSNLKPHMNHSSMFKIWDKRPREIFSEYMWDHTRDWVWADSESNRVQQFWVGWHLMIEYNCAKRSDLRYIRYNVEDMDIKLLRTLAQQACPTYWKGKGPPEDLMIKALTKVPDTYNHHGKVGGIFNKNNISNDVRNLARRYGYDY